MHSVYHKAEQDAEHIEDLARRLEETGDGYVTVADIQRAATLRYLFAEQRVGLAQQERRAYAALKLAMGLGQFDAIQIADSTLPTRRYRLLWEEVIDLAMTRRPELAQAELGVCVAVCERRAAKAEFMPDLVAFTRMQTIHDDASYANPNDNNEWAAGVTAALPLYAGGRCAAEIRRAGHLQVMARVRQMQAIQLVMQEVRDAYLEFQEMEERLIEARHAMDSAQAAQDLLDKELMLVKDQDISDFFEDVLTNRFLLATSSSRYYQARFGYDLALARVRLVTANTEIADGFSKFPAEGPATTTDRSRRR